MVGHQKFIHLFAAALLLMLAGSVFAPAPVTAAPVAVFVDCSDAGQTYIPEGECDALVDLYSATTGGSWTDNTGWMSLDSPCDWFGVTCSAGSSGYVTEINLASNNLVGTLPSTLENLTTLDQFRINDNSLTGSLPYGIEFPGLPLSVFHFNLTGLCEPDTPNFQSWLGSIGDLQSTGIKCSTPTPTQTRTPTVTLTVTGTPPDTATPTMGSGICGTQSSILQIECEALEDLYYKTNGAGWTDSTGWLADPDPCDWYGVECFGGHVIKLELPSNNLSGPLSSKFNDLDFLTLMNLNDNAITGSIPSNISGLLSIQYLILSNNSLTGKIPSSIGDLDELKTLSLDHNNLSGAIPSSIGNLTTLTVLIVDHNNLDGSIPGALGDLTDLWFLKLDHNDFSGGLTSNLAELSKLVYLALDDNVDLTGSLPTAFKDLDNMEYFYFEDTELCAPNTGPFNAWLNSLTDWYGTDLSCETPTPSGSGGTSQQLTATLDTNTPTGTLATQTFVATTTSDLLPPYQTLTQLAVDATMTATNESGFTLPDATDTATFYWDAGTDTPDNGLFATEEGAGTAQAETQAAEDAAEEGDGGLFKFPGLLSCGIGGGVLALLIGGGIELVNWLRRRQENS